MRNINKKNNLNQTLILLSCMASNENLFYLLYKNGADINIKDDNENSIYHYICKNKICLGFSVKNLTNKYGFTVEDYCQISKNNWKWI